MNATSDIQTAETLSTKAAQKELDGDLDAAFQLHIKAAQAFLHLARTLPETHTKGCRAAAARSLERAERIKQAKRDVRPVAADPYSAEEQMYILDKSALVNGLKFVAWQETDGREVDTGLEAFQDPNGQPVLPSTQQLESHWRRPGAVFPQPQSMYDASLLPEHVTQNVVTDCSVVAAIAVCLGHQRRFGSKLGMSSMYPQDAEGLPLPSKNGMYAVRVFMNGTWRKVNHLHFARVLSSIHGKTNGRLLGIRIVGCKDVLWPLLLEKAYMKLMGGYDFPGSNSAADLQALVGWIPEHVHLRSASFQVEGTWNRIFQGFSTGQCVVTLGTPSGVLSDDLIPTHDYAKWRTMVRNSASPYWIRGVIEIMIEIHTAPKKDKYIYFDPIAFQHFSWREACTRFDIIHINWDPSRFSRHLHVHGLWKPHKSASKLSQPVSNRMRVFMKGAKSWKDEVWVLLTRHIVGKHKAPVFISLNVALHDDEVRTTASSDKLSVHGTYSDSVHVLRRISPGMRSRQASIIVSIDKTDTEVGYTVTLLSDMDVTLDTKPQQGFYSKTLQGALTSRNCGGNFTHPTFMINPQYRLHLRSDAGRRSSENTKTTVRFSAEGPRDLPLNLKIVWSKGHRVTELVEGDVVSDTGAYSYGVAFGETELQAGEYTVVVSSFEPRQQGSFELSMFSLCPFDLEPIPAEGAGMYSKVLRGAWDRETSAGAPNFGRYHFNPIIKVSIPSEAQIIIRLQLLIHSASIALNVTLFVAGKGNELGPQVLTSGPYSDAIAGALIPRSAVAPGRYLLVPSTYMPKIEAEYQVLLYSTVSGVVLELWTS